MPNEKWLFPELETITDPPTLIEKIRWLWQELHREMLSSRSLSDPQRSFDIINDGMRLSERLEGILKTHHVPVLKPPMFNMIEALPRHATERYETRALSKINILVVHHSATPTTTTAEQIAAYHIGKGYPGIAYHYLVLANGEIQQVNSLDTWAYHAGAVNGRSIGVCLIGDFTNREPPSPQLVSTAHLLAWLCEQLNLTADSIIGHRDALGTATICPGGTWHSLYPTWKTGLIARVKRLLGQV